ncbi:acetylcholinesterase-like [Teleopsis dalmanni]|uniref:acetylcholinesterase-like n=1 Tax=Teleopsis dalmanni TaxID=139649 RepID=UPI0018CE6233|nr:acetylcholinesterase-like [Teleopsis dalmanni]
MFRTQNIKAYLGIPFAQAPRFAPPEIGNLKWPGVRNATSYGPNCFAGSTGFAVIVWIHAGDFSYGSSTTIDPFHLVFKQNVIVVTIAYRLNIFGFLSTGDGESPGNYGLMDQSAGLYWVRKNIHLFGGDPNKITIMGHSAGAISVGLHLTSREWSKDAFQKAVMMSGNHLAKDVVKNPTEYAKTLDMIANVFDCPNKPTYLLIQCLKRHDAKTIIDNMPPIEWGPVIDGGLSNTSLPFIETEPIMSFKVGNYHKVPLLIGLTDMEDALLIIENDNTNKITSEDFYKVISDIALNDLKKLYEPEFESVCSHSQIVIDSIDYIYDVRNGGDVLNSFVNFYTDKMYAAPTCQLADILTESESIYTYFFNIKPKTKFYELPTWVSVPKFYDQIFIWGVPYMNNYELVKEWNYTDKKISDIVMTLWANFAKTSNPTISNVYVKWTALPEVIVRKCRNCSPQQAENAQKLTTFLQTRYPDVWTMLLKKYQNAD